MAVLAGCSAEGIAERAIEERIEAEAGDDVDIDLDLGDGDASIRTDDGEISIETDDDGNVSIESGSGDERISIDAENGRTVIESETGTATISGGADLPADFPGDIVLPSGMEVLFAQQIDDAEGASFVVGGTVPGSVSDVADEFAAGLAAAGYTEEENVRPQDNALIVYAGDRHRVHAVIVPGDDGAGLQISVVPADS